MSSLRALRQSVHSSRDDEDRVMDIYSYIKADHRKVAKLIDDILAINLSQVRQQLFSDLRTELTLHAEAEEATFYTAIVEMTQSHQLSLKMDHAEHEHNEMRDLMQVLIDTPLSSAFWMEKFGELKSVIEHHVREEEDEVFPQAQVLISPGDAKALARDMARLKAEMRQEMAAHQGELQF